MKQEKFSSTAVFGDGLSDMGPWGKLTKYKYPPSSVGFYESTKQISNKEKGLNPDQFMNCWAVSASAKVHKIIADEAVKFINAKN